MKVIRALLEWWTTVVCTPCRFCCQILFLYTFYHQFFFRQPCSRFDGLQTPRVPRSSGTFVPFRCFLNGRVKVKLTKHQTGSSSIRFGDVSGGGGGGCRIPTLNKRWQKNGGNSSRSVRPWPARPARSFVLSCSVKILLIARFSLCLRKLRFRYTSTRALSDPMNRDRYELFSVHWSPAPSTPVLIPPVTLDTISVLLVCFRTLK